ncbi:MAG: TIR domain-containing protein [Anaerolineae bacterium]|nr:TIR domain-containing protein [Anaerolineae bacterium]
MSTTNQGRHIFISYARNDGIDYAERLERDLKQMGLEVWRDLTQLDNYSDFSVELEKAIRNATHVAVCLTPEVNQRDDSFVRREVAFASVLDKPIIPLKFPNADPIITIIHLTYIPFSKGTPPEEQLNYEEGLHKLIERIRAETERQEVKRPAAEDVHYPYLSELYKRIVSFLERTVTRELMVASRAETDAVETQQDPFASIFPTEFLFQAGIDESSAVFSNFGQAFRHYEGRVLLLGTPGSGKTTTLTAFARDAIARRLNNAQEPLPVLLPVSSWDPGQHDSIQAWILDRGAIPNTTPEQLDQMVRTGQLLLLLDGMDELLNRQDAQRKFMSLLPENNQIVVSCRLEEYNALDEKLRLRGAVSLLPLTDAQIRDYLKTFPGLWDMLVNDQDLRELARTPIMLNLLALGYSHARDSFVAGMQDADQQQLTNRIIGFFVEQRYDRERRRKGQLPFDLDEVKDELGRIAAQDKQKLHSVNLLSVEDFSGVLLTNRVQEFIDQMIDLGFLVMRGESMIGFTHRLIQDYFYADWVARLDHFHFAATYFEAFNWWGRYVTFPFCESLVAIWNHRDQTATDRQVWEIVDSFRQSYPVGSLREKQTSSHWARVRDALERLYVFFDLGGDPRLLPEDRRALRMATNEFRAESYRFMGDPDTAEAIYRESVEVYLSEEDRWNAAYQLGYLAGLHVQAGRCDEARATVRQSVDLAFEYAREDNEDDIKEILSLDAFALGQANLKQARYAEAGEFFAQAAFWAYAQLIDPGPPDDYTIKWYHDICLDSAALLLALDDAACAQALDALHRFWPVAPAVKTAAADPPTLARMVFPASITGPVSEYFEETAQAITAAFYALHPDLVLPTPENDAEDA